MKKNIFLAVVGAAALAGCTSEVMKERGFVPAPKDDSEVTAMAPVKGAPEADRSQVAPGAQRQQAGRAPAAVEFPPMTGDFGGKGLSDDGASAAPADSGEYIVKRGDTLGKIAAAHRVKLSALMKANDLTDKDAKRLKVGQKLTIPGGKAAKNAASGKRAAKADKKGVKSIGAANGKGGKPSIQPGEYIVKAGDTPERIARRAGVKLSALMAANNLTEQEARRLRIGQKLTIPENGKAVKSADKAAKPAEKPAKSAEQPDKPADELVSEMNKAELKDSAEQAAPAATPAAAPAAAEETEVVMASAEITLADFAKQHNTTPDELRKLNPDLKGDKLGKDAVLLVPKK